MTPQARAILRLLEERPEGITQQDSIREVACYRLAARISDLKAEGVPIDSKLIRRNGRSFAVYKLRPAIVQTEMGL